MIPEKEEKIVKQEAPKAVEPAANIFSSFTAPGNGKKRYIFFGSLALMVLGLVLLAVYFFFPAEFYRLREVDKRRTKMVEEKLVVPDTKKIETADGRVVRDGQVEIPLTPGEEEFVSAQALLTVRGGYGLAKQEAEKWSSDAKLVFIKSLGAVLLDGKSSQWQAAFGSPNKRRGYDIIIHADKVVSRKEVESTSFGFDLPRNWYDSDAAVKSLQALPQFVNASISSLGFYYNTDGKNWGYAFATSRGVTSMPVR